VDMRAPHRGLRNDEHDAFGLRIRYYRAIAIPPLVAELHLPLLLPQLLKAALELPDLHVLDRVVLTT